MIRFIKAGLFLLSVALVLTSCNTIQGMGKDIKQGGQAIENAASSGHTSNQSNQKTTTVKTTTKTPTTTQTTTQTSTTAQ